MFKQGPAIYVFVLRSSVKIHVPYTVRVASPILQNIAFISTLSVVKTGQINRTKGQQGFLNLQKLCERIQCSVREGLSEGQRELQ